MASLNLRTLPLLFLVTAGCAITSARSYPTALLKDLPDTSLTSAANLYPSGLIQVLAGSVDIPPLLHCDVTRPPYVIRWRVVDKSQEYDRIEIQSVTVQYDDESPESFVPQLDKTDLEFKGHSEFRDGHVSFYDHELKRHAPVTVTIIGTAIRKDGQNTSIRWSQSFEPYAQDAVGDWFSWCGSV